MREFLRTEFGLIEIIFLVAGALFLVSTIFIALGGNFTFNYLAKIAYFIGFIVLISKT